MNEYEKPTPMYSDEQLERMAFDVPASPGVWADKYIQLNAVKGIRGEYEEALTRMSNMVAMRERRIAELEAATQWQPVADDEFLGSSIESKDDLLTMYGADGDSIFVYLPEDIRLCRKVQP